jgi:transmembrane protein EpsG
MIIYLVFATSFLLALLAQKTNKKIWLCPLIALLGCFVGLRNMNIGADTETYHQFFQLISIGVYSPNIERSFLLLSSLILRIFGNETAIFLFFSIATNFCIIVRLWTLRGKAPFAASVLLYVILYYPQTCNIMRQYFAVSIIFLATILLEKRHYLLFATAVVIASLVHTSSLIALLLVPIFFFSSDHYSKRKKKSAFLLMLCVSPILVLVVVFLLSRYSSYFQATNNNFGLMNLARLVVLLLSVFVFRRELFCKNWKFWLKKDNNKFIVICALVGILFNFLGYFQTTLTRIGLCFNLFELIAIPALCFSGKKGKAIPITMYGFVLSYYFIVNALSGWSQLGNTVLNAL